MKKLTLLCITFFSQLFAGASNASSINLTPEHRGERKQVAAAILELHKLYISTGEAKKPMTISLPDIAQMAGLSEERTEVILLEFKEERLISVNKSAILILKKNQIKKIAG